MIIAYQDPTLALFFKLTLYPCAVSVIRITLHCSRFFLPYPNYPPVPKNLYYGL